MPQPLGTGPARPEAMARVAKELARLDPWTFWTVPFDDHLVVAGTTGVFLVVPEDAEGSLAVTGRRARVGGRPLRLRRLRAAAKGLGTRLSGGSVFATPLPVVCLTRAVTGAPRSIHGVCLVAVDQLAASIVGRERVLPPTRAQRAARLLGMTIAGDHRRHATVVRRGGTG